MMGKLLFLCQNYGGSKYDRTLNNLKMDSLILLIRFDSAR